MLTLSELVRILASRSAHNRPKKSLELNASAIAQPQPTRDSLRPIFLLPSESKAGRVFASAAIGRCCVLFAYSSTLFTLLACALHRLHFGTFDITNTSPYEFCSHCVRPSLCSGTLLYKTFVDNVAVPLPVPEDSPLRKYRNCVRHNRPS